MIIRHDLKLIFVHVPKCAGKQVRWIFKQGAKPDAIEELWNYEHNSILNRYVDRAHLPLSDFRAYPQFKYLNRYRVVACIRDPYMRLPSAVNEYYRQKSKKYEDMANNGPLTMELRRDYYKKLVNKHSQLDPRFIHSLPIHRFTHYGEKAKVDYLLRCERLGTDIKSLSETLGWPEEMKKAIQEKFEGFETTKASFKLTREEEVLAEMLYKIDFDTFGYRKRVKDDTEVGKKICQSGDVKCIHNCDEVAWHWGPTAKKGILKLKANRQP